MQKHVNLVDLVKSFPPNIYLQNLASIQKRTSPVKFAHLAEKSGKGSISNLLTKASTAAASGAAAPAAAAASTAGPAAAASTADAGAKAKVHVFDARLAKHLRSID